MGAWIAWAIENAIVNSVTIVPAMWIAGAWLDLSTLKPNTRSMVLASAGVIGGLAGHAYFNDPRGLEGLEAAILGPVVFVYALLLHLAVRLIKHARQEQWLKRATDHLKALARRQPVQIGALTFIGGFLVIASFNPARSSHWRGRPSSSGASIEPLPFALGLLALVVAWLIYKKWSISMRINAEERGRS